jgi:DNA processing protein
MQRRQLTNDARREVFALPGSPLDPRCGGTNDLIRQGTVLTENTGDILSHSHSLPAPIALLPTDSFDSMTRPLDDEELAATREKVLENLGPSPILIDELIRECQLSAPLALTVLLELGLAGRTERQAGQ